MALSKSQEAHTGVIKESRSIRRIGKADVYCIDQNAPLTEAARLMREHHVGDLVVTETKNGMNKPIGIITDRDILIETLGQAVKPGSVNVSDIMSRTLATAKIDDDVFSMIETMKDCGVSRLPLIDRQGHLSGIVTAKNLFQVLCKGLVDLSAISERQQKTERENRH